jgi:hypothetical protein
MSYTDEQKLAIAEKVIARQEKQKSYDRWYLAKARHELLELRRVVKANALEDEMVAFDKSQEDYI